MCIRSFLDVFSGSRDNFQVKTSATREVAINIHVTPSFLTVSHHLVAFDFDFDFGVDYSSKISPSKSNPFVKCVKFEHSVASPGTKLVADKVIV